MSGFPPIAIVGQACILPGANSPHELWHRVLAGEDLLTTVPKDRWRANPATVMGRPDWNNRAGYVHGFDEIFDPEGFSIKPQEILALDPLVHWVLHTARQALNDAKRPKTARVGAVLGNLSLPSEGLAKFAESIWLKDTNHPIPQANPLDRFMSGLPAQLLAQALNLDAGAFALDAACASSLYAIKLACDRLHDYTADIMLAGAVNRADQLFLHIGFQALQALSPTGQSRPFHRDADGLVPSEGAAFITLKRLDDAERAGDHILGVIRAVGLSNDGRSQGLLVPSSAGQIRSIQNAYQQSGIDPRQISLVECHATGTALGDGKELQSLGNVFTQNPDLPIGSLKSNIGHTITVAGLAGLIKILGAMESATRPPTLHTERPLDALQNSNLRLLTRPEPWHIPAHAQKYGTSRTAAISAFGFGGNNSHLIVEQYTPRFHNSSPGFAPAPAPKTPQIQQEEIAIVALGVTVNDHHGRHQFAQALRDQKSFQKDQQAHIPLKNLRFPPRDLQESLGQQTLILEAAHEALTGLDLPRNRTSVLIGMGCDPNIVRHGLAARLNPDPHKKPTLTAATVIGSLPNIVANRINAQFDFAGPSFTVSAEETSGITALELAARALQHHEIDAAVIGAVDICIDEVHQAAIHATHPPTHHTPGNAAVVLVLERATDARANKHQILATIKTSASTQHLSIERSGASGPSGASWRSASPGALPLGSSHTTQFTDPNTPHTTHDITPTFGHTHAAHGLLTLAAHILSPQKSTQHLSAERSGASGPSRAGLRRPSPWALPLGAAPESPSASPESPRIFVEQILDRTTIIVAATPDELAQKRARTEDHLRNQKPLGEGIYFQDHTANPGQENQHVASVFTGAATAYHGMGRELISTFPEILQTVRQRFSYLDQAAEWFLEPIQTEAPDPLQKLFGCSILCQAHAAFTQQILGLKSNAAIGFSSGETNALFAMGAWPNMDRLYTEFSASGAFTHILGGDFDLLKQAWAEHQITNPQWETWRVVAPQQELQEALKDEPFVHITLIHAPDDCAIGGETSAVHRVVQKIGPHRARHIGYDIVVHSPEVAYYAETWRKLHTQPTNPVPDVRFYTHSTNSYYHPTPDAAAQALLGQALRTVNFPQLIENAYQDGVRIFVEHGPQTTLTPWIHRILGDRPHTAVALDAATDPSLRPLANAIAQLLAAGVQIDYQAYNTRIDQAGHPFDPNPKTLHFPLHPGPISIPKTMPKKHTIQHMAPAPTLPSTTSHTTPSARVYPDADTTHFDEPGGSSPGEHRTAHTSGTSPQTHTSGTSTPATQILQNQLNATSQAHHAYLATLATQTHVHQQFLAQSQRAFFNLTNATPQTPITHTPPTPHITPSARVYPDADTTHFDEPGGSSPGVRRDAHTSGTSTPNTQILQSQLNATTNAHNPTPINHPQTTNPQTPTRAAGPLAPAERIVPSHPMGSAFGRDVAHPPISINNTAHNPTPINQHTAHNPTPINQHTAHNPTPQHEIHPQTHYTRTQLKTLASGKISEVFGPLFAIQDHYPRQVRMPEEPLLLADRICGIAAEPGVIGTGTIYSETDITWDSWYLQNGHIPPGIMIESGQADLLLISWMGADFENRGERVYRLLGCELTYQNGLPKAGDTMKFDIHINGHAQMGATRMFFFHSDCRVDGDLRLSVRNGQAGFFTDKELAESQGILWTPETGEHRPDVRLDPPQIAEIPTSFTRQQVLAFGDGDGFACFGKGYELLQTHTRTPAIHAQKMSLMGEVLDLNIHGGPWKRGYMRTRLPLAENDWFLDGHFKNDPCMPGTLMFEGGLQAISFYIAALGYTLKRDGWRFEPVPDLTYQLRCRGQATPASRELIYEIFIEEIIDGPTPTIYADILATIDGLKAFHCRGMGVQLIPDFPMSSIPQTTNPQTPTRAAGPLAPAERIVSSQPMGSALGRDAANHPTTILDDDANHPTTILDDNAKNPTTLDNDANHPTTILDDDANHPTTILDDNAKNPTATITTDDGHTHTYDYTAMLACALGKPSDAMGPHYKIFDGTRRMPRLPRDPFHFLTRATNLDGTPNVERIGTTVTLEYDVPEDAWYFDQKTIQTMPFAILMETTLQPCGWISLFTGAPVRAKEDVFYRNLDGTGTLLAEIPPTAGTLKTNVTLTASSVAAGMVIQSFTVEMSMHDQPIYHMDTTFGFFPAASLAKQAGLPTTPEDYTWLDEPNDFLVDLTTQPPKFFGNSTNTSARLPEPQLLMIDRIDGFWPTAGQAGLGRVRARKDVDPGEWFFKSHFYQDPVQPGSLGIEAMIQTLQFAMLQLDLAKNMQNPRFLPIALGQPLTWKYRGQVLPHHKRVTIELEITHIEQTKDSITATATAYLWVDGLRIYSAQNLTMTLQDICPQ